MKTLTIFIIALATLNFGSAAALADDMWSETPDLNNLTTPSYITEPARLSNQPPKFDMWVETPDLHNNNDSLDFHHEKAVVKSGLANPEMYAETPDLKKVSPAENDHRSPDEVMVAERKKREIGQQKTRE